ncbi:uncharacterized protein LOC113003458 [Solenopsis invicta]|uniref:uncharacterized protein LOC113003458 n=1 Tax=Solenopsis invicta TaxID=13686 RepID=UPI000E340008|nr:uncharacterized protein LOC113003458 [Solenopsis invicta]
MDNEIEETCEFCFQAIHYGREHICYSDVIDSSQQQDVNEPLTIIQDMESFIETVEQTRILWDHTIPYAKRGAASIKKAWADIDKMFNVVSGTSQIKWWNLRDTYVRKLTEQKKYVASGSAASCRPKKEMWPYFEMMAFLRPCVSFKRTYSNIEASIENRSSCSEKQGHSSSSDNQTTPFKKPIERYSQEFLHDKRYESSHGVQSLKTLSDRAYPLTPSPTGSSTSTSDSSEKPKRARKTKVSTSDQLSPLESNLINQLQITDTALSNLSTSDSLDPVITFTNYLGSRMKQLSKEKFDIFQRRVLMELFKVEDE